MGTGGMEGGEESKENGVRLSKKRFSLWLFRLRPYTSRGLRYSGYAIGS